VQMWIIMNNWINALGDSFLSKTFSMCYSLSSCILIEPTMPKRIEIIQLTNVNSTPGTGFLRMSRKDCLKCLDPKS
jgi:hypothetical protein